MGFAIHFVPFWLDGALVEESCQSRRWGDADETLQEFQMPAE
jgi:hypothetical protein